MSAVAKICSICGKSRRLERYHRDKQRADGRKKRCAFCVNARDRQKYEESTRAVVASSSVPDIW